MEWEKRLTDPEGNNPVLIPPGLRFQGLEETAGLVTADRLLVDGADVQALRPEMQFSLQGELFEADYTALRGQMDALEAACGLGRVRVYFHSDRYLLCQSQGMTITLRPGTMQRLLEIELPFTALIPAALDDADDARKLAL